MTNWAKANPAAAAKQLWVSMAQLPFGPAKGPGPNIRLHELDGLRGWAALSVVSFHMFWETFGVLMPSIRNPITGFLLDGGFAVAVFFILSGEALSSAYFNGKGELSVIKLALKRYTRLTIPIIAISVVIFLLLKLHLVQSALAGQLVHQPDWLGSFLQFPATAKYFLKFALLDVYGSIARGRSVDPFLWTMQYEMAGSILVFGIVLSFTHIRMPWIVLFLAATALLVGGISGMFSCFIFGIIFSAIRVSGAFSKIQNHRLSLPVSYAAILLLCILDGLAHWKFIATGYVAILAIPVMFAVFCNRQLCKFFSNRLSRVLGFLSFPIFLVQFPVIVSFTSYAIIFASHHGGLNMTSMLSIAFCSVAVCLFAAYMFTPVETLTRFIGNLIIRALIPKAP